MKGHYKKWFMTLLFAIFIAGCGNGNENVGERNNFWSKTYDVSDCDEAMSIQQTGDSGYITAGYTNSFGAGLKDFLVLKLDSDGSVAWQKTYGGAVSEQARSIRQTGDGGYIAAGYTRSFGAGLNDSWVLKLNSDGSIAWQKTYGGSGDERTKSIWQTSDGGYIAAGYTGSFGAGLNDFWVLKLNSDGSVAWEKTYGGPDDEQAMSIRQTSDSGYIVSGYTKSFGAGLEDIWVLKLNLDGSIAWQKTYGGARDERARIRQTSDGGYILVGRTWSFGAGGPDYWVLKLNSGGSVVWEKTYGWASDERAKSIRQTSDGGYIVAGYTGLSTDSGDVCNVWILKLASDGSISFNSASGASTTDTIATVSDTSATVSDTTASIDTPAVTPSDSSAIVTDTDAAIQQQAP